MANQIYQVPTSHPTVLLPGCEPNGSDAHVEVTLEVFDRISEYVRKGPTRDAYLDVEGVMASPELGIDNEIPCGDSVCVRVAFECDTLLYEFQPID